MLGDAGSLRHPAISPGLTLLVLVVVFPAVRQVEAFIGHVVISEDVSLFQKKNQNRSRKLMGYLFPWKCRLLALLQLRGRSFSVMEVTTRISLTSFPDDFDSTEDFLEASSLEESESVRMDDPA